MFPTGVSELSVPEFAVETVFAAFRFGCIVVAVFVLRAVFGMKEPVQVLRRTAFRFDELCLLAGL